MRVYEEEIPKTDFRTCYGYFEFTVMPFVLIKEANGLHEAKGGARVTFKDEFGAAEEREVSCETQQSRSGIKRKLFRSFRNKMGNEPILALPKGLDNFVVMREARVRMRA
nr:putative reverse transcriptase domain-containing protein [Tanacetum cinerariifolium]